MIQMKRLVLFTGLLILLLVTGSPRVYAAGSADLGVSATIPSWGFCSFRSNNYSVDFGALNPANPVDASSQVDVQFRCFGLPSVTYYINHDGGLYGSGPAAMRMKHQTLNAYLPYALTLSQTSGTIPTFFVSAWQTLQVTGTVLGSDYQSASAGQYSDAVVLTIVP
jgi:Spore Coat Protein U domain